MKLQFPGGTVDASTFGAAEYVPGQHPTTKQYPCDSCGELRPINGSTLIGAPFLCGLCVSDGGPPRGCGRHREPELSDWERRDP